MSNDYRPAVSKKLSLLKKFLKKQQGGLFKENRETEEKKDNMSVFLRQ